jgi:hypothetical protein
MLKLTRAPRGVRNFLTIAITDCTAEGAAALSAASAATIAIRGIATTISAPYGDFAVIVSLGVFHRLSCLFEAFMTKQTVDNTDSKCIQSSTTWKRVKWGLSVCVVSERVDEATGLMNRIPSKPNRRHAGRFSLM